MTCQLFSYIGYLFWSKNPLDVAREEPILLKKLTKGDVQWSTNSTVLGWAIDASGKILALPRTRRGKLSGGLADIPNIAAMLLKKNW